MHGKEPALPEDEIISLEPWSDARTSGCEFVVAYGRRTTQPRGLEGASRVPGRDAALVAAPSHAVQRLLARSPGKIIAHTADIQEY